MSQHSQQSGNGPGSERGRQSEAAARTSGAAPRTSEGGPRESAAAARPSGGGPRESEAAPRGSEAAPRESAAAARQSEGAPRPSKGPNGWQQSVSMQGLELEQPGSEEGEEDGFEEMGSGEPSQQSMTVPSFGHSDKLPSYESLTHPYNTKDKDFVNAKAFLLQASTLTGLNL